MTTTRKISIKAGPPVEGPDFYGREKELEYVWKYHLSASVPILLSAPRRVGKTSFAKKVISIAKDQGWQTLYLDLQGISIESEFVRLFKEELQKETWWESAKTKFGDTLITLLDSIGGAKIAGNELSMSGEMWRNDTYGKIKQLLEKTGSDTLIVIDELTIFLSNLMKQENGNEKVEFFLAWLRKFRQDSKVRWVICSSIGIENFASMHHLSKHINDFIHYEIKEFSKQEAEDFISKLDVDDRVTFEESHKKHIIEKLEWCLPYFIQLLVEKINYLIFVDGLELSNDTIDMAYNHLVSESSFNTWDERLKDYEHFEDNARKILKLCAASKEVSKRTLLTTLSTKRSDVEKIETTLSQLLSMLVHDGYLIAENGNYHFRSPLLKDFWSNRYL